MVWRMRDKHTSGKPFQALGGRLKSTRENRRETLAEVSGAVEIDIETLERIEQGLERPSEDILMLLISHFGLKDSEAEKLWDLAGFGKRDQANDLTGDDISGKTFMMMVPMDPRIVYSDIAHVSANKFGVVVNFMQTGGMNNQPLAVARIGMSREHAESVIELLQNALAQSSQPAQKKSLPAPKSKKHRKTDTN